MEAAGAIAALRQRKKRKKREGQEERIRKLEEEVVNLKKQLEKRK